MAKYESKGAEIKHSGTYHGKSNVLGHGGRSAQLDTHLKSEGLSAERRGAIEGSIARKLGAAPGGPNYHGKRK